MMTSTGAPSRARGIFAGMVKSSMLSPVQSDARHFGNGIADAIPADGQKKRFMAPRYLQMLR